MKTPEHTVLMDTTTLLRELRTAVRQWNSGKTTHESAMEHVAELLKQYEIWARRKV